MNAKYVALPNIVPERDGIVFEAMNLPVGLDEERIVVNTKAIRRIARIAGLGGITVVGGEGKTSDYSADVTGISNDGSATLRSTIFKKQSSFVNGVKVNSWHEDETWASYNDAPQSDYFRYGPVLISANTNERDERLRDTNKYKFGLYDTKGHANFIDKTLSAGLSEATSQRYSQRPSAFYGNIFVPAAITLNAAAILGGQNYSFSFFLGQVFLSIGAIDVAYAAVVANKLHGNSIKDAQFSCAFGLDRKFAAIALAKTTIFAKTQK